MSASVGGPGGSGLWTRLLPAATFLVGLTLGGVLVAVGAGGGGSEGDASGEPTSSPSPTAGGSLAPGDTVVTVPLACEESAENLREATGLLRDSLGSVRDFDPDRLVEILNRLEEIDEDTRPLLDECSVDVSRSPSATETPSESPAESPAESPSEE